MKLMPEFQELLKHFNTCGVEYVLVGGYALAYHGHPRATKDIDLFIGTEGDNAARVRAALDAFGFSGIGPTIDNLQDSATVIRFGAPPNMVDLLKSIDGLGFRETFNNSLVNTVADLPVRIISREDLIRNKRASQRYQDLADLEALGELQPRRKFTDGGGL